MKFACISTQHECPVQSPKELRDIVWTARRTVSLSDVCLPIHHGIIGPHKLGALQTKPALKKIDSFQE
jgi:hypothetical protein